MNNVRLLYVSKFKINANSVNVLYDILTEALNFNSLNGICGALYCGNNYFVQCLEGPKEKIEHLFYKKILKDPRHENCEVLYFEDIDIPLFSTWYMKYALIHKEVMNFFYQHHNDNFNPYLLNASTIPHFIELLSKHNDSFAILRSKALITANPI